ncbi:hypothetical protein PAXRUDRAFT_159623, partial [Paxillus rubicundulus Ve08.2h10]
IPKTVKDAQGRATAGPDVKIVIKKIPMADYRHPNSQLQPLYFTMDHEKAGGSKAKCGYSNAPKLFAECKDWKCPGDDHSDCCCHSLMYSQPDFFNAKSLIMPEVLMGFFSQNFTVLNFIEQCWGFAKQLYQMKDWLSSEDVLERNVISSLDAVPMSAMWQFINAYDKSLDGTQAEWAIKKSQGHP